MLCMIQKFPCHCVSAVGVILVIVQGFIKSLGIVLIEIQTYFQCDPKLTGLIVSILLALYFMLGSVSANRGKQ